MRTVAFLVPAASPDDLAGLAALFDAKRLHAREVVAIFGRVAAPRGSASVGSRLVELLAARRSTSAAEMAGRVVVDVEEESVGVVSPHLLVLGRRDDEATLVPGHMRLAIGVAKTRAFGASEIGRTAQIAETARVVRELTRSLEVESASDVHLVHVGAALPEVDAREADLAVRNGRPLRVTPAFSRGASALGVAVATREVSESAIRDEDVCASWDLYATNAAVTARPGRAASEILVVANSPRWSGDLVADHGPLVDVLDAEGARATLRRLAIPLSGHVIGPEDRKRIVGCLARCGVDAVETLRGRRVLRSDDAARACAALSAVLASVTGDPAVTVARGAEHVGPPGGGAVTILSRY